MSTSGTNPSVVYGNVGRTTLHGAVGGDRECLELYPVTSVAGAIATIDGGAGIPEAPLDAVGAVSAVVVIDSNAANALMGFRATMGEDDVDAAEKLATGFGCRTLSPDSSVAFYLPTPRYSVDFVGIVNGAAVNNCISSTDTVANALANKVRRTFTTGVSKVVLTMLAAHDTGQRGLLTVEGYRYA